VGEFANVGFAYANDYRAISKRHVRQSRPLGFASSGWLCGATTVPGKAAVPFGQSCLSQNGNMLAKGVKR